MRPAGRPRTICRLGVSVFVALVAGTVGRPHGSAAADTPPYPVPALDMALSTNDLALDDARQLVYASVPGSGGAADGTIAEINPETWSVTRTVPAGGEPSGIEIAPDGSMLYVRLNGASTLRQLSLPDMTLVRDIALPSGQTVADIAVMPTDPHIVAVVLRPTPEAVAAVTVFDRGVALNDVVHDFSAIEWSSTSDLLYAYDGRTSSGAFGTLRVGPTGVTQEAWLGGALPPFSSFEVSDGLVYSYNVVFDPTTMTRLGTLPGDAVVSAHAPGTDRVYATGGNLFGLPAETLSVKSTSTFTVVDAFGLDLDPGQLPVQLVPLADGAVIARTAPFFTSGAGPGKLYLLSPAKLRGAAGEFTPLTPARLLDTRDGTGAVPGALGPGSTLDVQITGRNGVPATGVDAVVVNATVTQPTAPGYLTVWPAGRDRPTISNLNFQPSQTVANLVTVGVGDGGKISVFNSHGSSHVVFDVAGYYSTSDGAPGARFHPVRPKRLFDTRTGQGGVRSRLGPSDTLRFDVTGVAGVPAEGTKAVIMNVTAVAPSASGYVTVSPGDGARPLVSNINFAAGGTTANLVTVRVPESGVIEFFSEYGTVDLIADVVGYYDLDRSTEHGRFVSYQPYRRFDSRAQTPSIGDSRLAPGSTLVLGFGAVPATAYVFNVTVTEPTSHGYVTAFPVAPPLSGLPLDIPDSSSVNFGPGQTVPNMAVAPPGPRLGFYNSHGNTHLIVDAFGDFT